MDTPPPVDPTSLPLQYAVPKEGPRHSWLACIVGLFAWGALVLTPIPLIAGSFAYGVWVDGGPLNPGLEEISIVTVLLLLLGLPPLITARYMMRREFKLVRLTVFVTAIPALFGLIFALILCLFAVGNSFTAGSLPALLAIVLVLVFAAVLWLAVALEDLAGFRNATRYDNLRF